MIRHWDTLSTDWKRWARWWALLVAIVMLGMLVSPAFWVCLFVLLVIVPSD